MKDLSYYSTPSHPYPDRADYKRYSVLKEDQVYGLGLTFAEVQQLPQISELVKSIKVGKFGVIDPLQVIEFCRKAGITIVPYFNEADYKQAREAYNAEINSLQAEFKVDLFEEFGVTDNPKAELCFSKAWERGHAYGYSDVYSVFSDIVELIQ